MYKLLTIGELVGWYVYFKEFSHICSISFILSFFLLGFKITIETLSSPVFYSSVDDWLKALVIDGDYGTVGYFPYP